MALAGLRWGELAGLQVADRVRAPGPGLRLRRAVLASGGGGALYVDTLKNKRARTVPLVEDLVPVVDRWSAGKAPDAWLAGQNWSVCPGTPRGPQGGHSERGRLPLS
jgi:integrase